MVNKKINYAGDYYKSVLSPFNTICSRGPSDFYQPTSLFDYKLIVDTTAG